MVKLASADLVVCVGLELEIGWLPSLLTGSRNPKVQPGAAGYLDASAAVSPIEETDGRHRSVARRHPSARQSALLARSGERTQGRPARRAEAQRARCGARRRLHREPRVSSKRR
jgi:zinc/manganese transport system substrate-binding protein